MAKSRALFVVVFVLLGCGGPDHDAAGGGDFWLIEFHEAGQNNIARNRSLTFVFSAPVAPGQHFFERINIQNVQVGGGQSNLSRAIGIYVVSGERVTFAPRLPTATDRSDAGFRADASYHVFLKAGLDALVSVDNQALISQQEFTFGTNAFFDDPVPDDPPRVLRALARDPFSGETFDIGRLDPRPAELAQMDSNDLVQGERILEPGGAPGYTTPWELELHMSEPLDPATVLDRRIELFEIAHDALTGADFVAPGHVSIPVQFRVPIDIELVQGLDAQGKLQVFIRLKLVQPLLDDARYRLALSGEILGLDYRKTFVGINGLTGDGMTLPEPGGLGYVTEFLVFDRPAIDSSVTLTYDPESDGIHPETGQTTTDPALRNNALYDPITNPGRALGAGGAGELEFGDGDLGAFVITAGQTVILDTGDTPNGSSGNPFSVTEVDPEDAYSNLGLPDAETLTFDPQVATDFALESLTIASGGTLRIIGVNPCRILVRGLADIRGTVDASGSDGAKGGTSTTISGGGGGPAGFAGGGNKQPDKSCRVGSAGVPTGNCSSFDAWLSVCTPAQAGFPYTFHGEGPGRGHAGGEAYPMWAWPNASGIYGSVTGTGGGGGSHATSGQPGEDRLNVGGTAGTAGPACAGGAVNSATPITAPPTPPAINIPNAGVIGVRGVPGSTYGDREGRFIKMGGSGGGAGGSIHTHLTANGANVSTGGTGGGGGGYLELTAGTGVIVLGGRITVAGGAGGKGVITKNTTLPQGGVEGTGWETISGSAGGGAGGTIRIITTGDIVLRSGAVLDARGGAGGGSPDNPVTPPIQDCKGCNAGGDGGKGFIFLMDGDGNIEGIDAADHGLNDDYAFGVLTTRSATISAITQLFRVPAPNPDYQALLATEILALTGAGQRVRIFASSCKADPDDPRKPDLATETPGFEVALVSSGGVSITGDAGDLNPTGQPERDDFVRIRAQFEYDNARDGVVGPFAFMEEIILRFRFNG